MGMMYVLKAIFIFKRIVLMKLLTNRWTTSGASGFAF
jgi:hypothetical protein